MSKQSEAKKKQGYVAKPEIKKCSNCKNYSSQLIPNGYGYNEEKNIRCGIGGFAIKKTAVCDEFKKK